MKNDIKYYEIDGVKQLISVNFRIINVSDANYKSRICVTLSNGFVSRVSYISENDLSELKSLANSKTKYNLIYHKAN